MADIKLFDTDELKEQAETKRKENTDFDEYENKNPYSKAAMEELVTGEPSKGNANADFVMDLAPTAIMLFTAKGMKKTPAYKRAKLREAANMTDYSMTGPEVLTYVEGPADNPYGQLARAVKYYYGKDDKKRVSKELENGILKAIKTLKKKNPKLTDTEIVEMIESVRTGKNIDKFMKEDLDIIKNSIKDINFTPAQKIVDENIKTTKTPGGKTKVEVNTLNKIASSTPAALTGVGTLLAVGDIADKAWKLPEYNTLERLKKSEKGLQPTSPFFTLTEFLDGLTNGTWRYNKNETIKEVNKIFDYIQENGTEEQLKRAYEIYADTDFTKKSEAVDALKQLLKLKE